MTFNQKYTKKKPKVKGGPPLMPGDTVFEVFINHVKKATVTAISRCRSPDNKAKEKYNYIISISCEDGTLSPRYYATDLGKFIFLAEEEAKGLYAMIQRESQHLEGLGVIDRFRLLHLERDMPYLETHSLPVI